MVRSPSEDSVMSVIQTTLRVERALSVELESAAAGEVAGRVPPRVLERHEDFSRCPACDRIYWKGSDAERMRSLVDRIFEEAAAPPDPP